MHMQVAGLHRAGPSAALDKAVQLCVNDYISNPAVVKGQSAKFVRIAGSAAKKLRRRSPAEFLCVYAARESRAAQVRALPLSASKTCMTPPPKLKWTSSP